MHFVITVPQYYRINVWDGAIEFHENSNSEVVLKSIQSGICSFPSILRLKIAYGHVNANSVDVIRLNILSWDLLDPIGTSRVKGNKIE